MKRLAACVLLCAAPALAGSVTLEQCTSAALEGNPGLQAQVKRSLAAEAAIRQARSAYYPMVGLSAQLARTDNAPQAFMMVLNQRQLDFNSDFNNPDDTENLRLSAGAQWLLWDSGRRGLQIDMAAAGAAAQAEMEGAARNQLVHDVARAYGQALQAKAFVGVNEDQVKSLEESLRVARERFQAGSAVKSDVLNLDVKLSEAQDELIRARHGHLLAVAALNTAIGRDLVTPDDSLVKQSVPEEVPALPTRDDIEARPELKAARAAIRAREAAARKAAREYGPSVHAFGSYDFDSDVSSDFEESYMVGVAASVEVFDGMRRRGGRAEAEAELEAAKAAEASLANQLRLDLQQAILQVAEARERLATARKSIESADESLRITQERYAQGATDVTELLTAETGRTASRARLIASEHDYSVALSNARRAHGDYAAPTTPEGSTR